MKFLTFTYTKSTGSVTERVFVPLSKPDTMYEGYDITELSEEDQALFLGSLMSLKEDYEQRVNSLLRSFDATFSYRRFDPLKMTNKIEEEI